MIYQIICEELIYDAATSSWLDYNSNEGDVSFDDKNSAHSALIEAKKNLPQGKDDAHILLLAIGK